MSFLLLIVFTLLCCQSTPGMGQVDYTDMGSYQHGVQLNMAKSSDRESVQKVDQAVQTCVKADNRAAMFYRRLIGSLLTQMRVSRRKLNPGETLTLDLKAEISAKDLSTLQMFIEKDSALGLDADDSYIKIDSILTSFIEVSPAPKYVDFLEFVSLQWRKWVWNSAETFNLLIIIFFILVFSKLVSFLAKAQTVSDIFKLVLGFIVILTIFVVILESQGYVLWQSLPTEAIARVFSSVAFRYLEDLIDSVTNNISKDFMFSSAFQPFIKILVWVVFLIFWIFILLLFSVMIVLLFTVREIFSNRILTWFGVTIEPVRHNPHAINSEIRQRIQDDRKPQFIEKPQIVERPQILRVVARKPKVTANVATQVSMRDLVGEEEFVEIDEGFELAED